MPQQQVRENILLPGISYSDRSVMRPVQIKSIQDMIDELSCPVGVNLICITDSEGVDKCVADTLLNAFGHNASSVLVREFDDVTMAYPGVVVPSLDDMRCILKWSKDRDDLTVCDSHGISSSAAVAFLIECTRRPAMEALSILDPSKHSPNEMIIGIGVELGIAGLMDSYLEFLRRARAYL